MITTDIVNNFIKLIPENKVVTIQQIADVFCTSKDEISSIVGNNTKVISSEIGGHNIWKPILTNYYVSLITRDTQAISVFESISRKIILLHPNCVVKTPNYYHITLADLSNTKISKTLIDNIFSEANGLHMFSFLCQTDKPYIDKKKNKVIFWIRIDSNPFLITLHQCIKKHVPRRSDKNFTPHITLGKILGNVEYNQKCVNNDLHINCVFDSICITANIDQNKDQILFIKHLG